VITSFLGLARVFVPPVGARRSLMASGARLNPAPPPYLPHQDRNTHIRFCSCSLKYPRLVKALMERIEARLDFDLCQYLCHNISCDSNLEPLLLLHLLSCGAHIAMRAPSLFGHTRWPIVDCQGNFEVGHRARPCMVIDGTWYFFQLSFKTSRTLRVDALCWDGSWFVVEINGSGHDFRGDEERYRELGLPVRNISEQQLLEIIQTQLWKQAG